MNETCRRITLQEFLSRILKRCSSMEKKEITDFLLEYAKQLDAKQRLKFLTQIETYAEEAPAAVSIPAADEVAELIHDIEKRAEAIEDGSIYDDPEFPWEEFGLDDEPDHLTGSHIDRITAYFQQADQAFISGFLQEALTVYEPLMILFARGHSSLYEIPIDRNETKARYLRCLYELTPLTQRGHRLLQVLADLEGSPGYFFNPEHYDYDGPTLQDIAQTRLEPLPEQEVFLVQWISLLQDSDKVLEASLLLEAVHLQQGIDGVRRLARSWGSRQPRGYRYLLEVLEQNQAYAEITDAAQEAFKELPVSLQRGKIAGRAVRAAAQLQDTSLLLAMKQELCYSVPNDVHASLLLEEASLQDSLQEELLSLACCTGIADTPLKIKVLLMQGKLTEAAAGKNFDQLPSDALGWSISFNRKDRPTGLIFAAVLAYFAGDRINEAVTIVDIFSEYTKPAWSEQALYAHPEHHELHTEGYLLRKLMLEGISTAAITGTCRQQLFQWALQMGNQRIHDIVSRTYRKSYHKAAAVLCGLCEALILMGRQPEARQMLLEFRNVRYPRHSSFKRELDSTVRRMRLKI